jgi:hypothetical protein
MLTIGKRYFIRYNGNEKVITINNQADLNYWLAKAKDPEIKISELKVSAPPEDTCASCSA